MQGRNVLGKQHRRPFASKAHRKFELFSRWRNEIVTVNSVVARKGSPFDRNLTARHHVDWYEVLGPPLSCVMAKPAEQPKQRAGPLRRLPRTATAYDATGMSVMSDHVSAKQLRRRQDIVIEE
jgi:hypothetical protein